MQYTDEVVDQQSA